MSEEKLREQLALDHKINSTLFVRARKGMTFISREGVKYEHDGKHWKEAVKVTEDNIPHYARLVNQFRLEEKKNYVSTGKVLCFCNCGETTGWIDILDIDNDDGFKAVRKFFTEHQVSVEIGVRVDYSLGELAGYRIEYSGLADPSLTLLHSCGWQKDLSSYTAENLLTNIVLEVVGNKHICLNGELKS